MIKSLFKKLAFFWIIFHSIAFLSFKLQWTPSIDKKEGVVTRKDYIFTPEYTNNGYLVGSQHCYNCNYKEKTNFYPFHKFTYGWGTSYQKNKGFIGIFGYYGNDEYIVYVIIPVFIYIIFALYRLLFKKSINTKI